MTKFTRLMALTTIAGFAFSATALAGPKADINQDGQITQAEFRASANEKFTLTDTDFDGTLSKDEVQSRRAAKKAERSQLKFAKKDLNGDGAITQDEVSTFEADKQAAREARKLERHDSNGDGVIDADERTAAIAAREAKRAERKATRRAKGESKGQRAKIKRDTNGDGIITRVEYDASVDALFLRMDVNGDGVLTKGEGPRTRRGRAGKGSE